MMNILRLDPPSSKGARALDDHIEALLLLIHSKNLALSDLSEVENRPSRPLSAAEHLLASVGEDAHQIALAVETLIAALRAQRYRRRTTTRLRSATLHKSGWVRPSRWQLPPALSFALCGRTWRHWLGVE